MKTRTALGFTLVVIALVAACAGSGGAPPVSPTPPGSTQPAPIVGSPEEAAARVLGSDQRFAGIGRRDPNLIGQGSWWQAEARGDGFRVQVEIGWGDCPAGCINRHDWVFDVATDGTITLVEETGPPLEGATT